jgi:hypothetical protein
MKSSLVSTSQPRCVAVGDVNNDHQMDIVVANSGTNTIGIFLSKGNGTFADQQIYFTGPESRPYWIALSDFNDDHCLDVAAANYGTNSIGILLGNGNGTFADQKLFSLGSSRPLFVTVGDFDNDNRMDIVVANNGTDSISILLGYGDGSFPNQTTYSTGYDSVPSSITVADFNNDNQVDIAVTNNGIGNLGIFFGHGNGTFVPQITYSTGIDSHPQQITVGDFNQDNQLDIAIADSKNDRVYVFPGFGNGSFAAITTYDTISGSSPYSIAAIDFNNNNQSDIAIANYGANNVLVLLDYSIKPSARQTNYYDGWSSNVFAVAIGDLNNDHIFDIIYGTETNIFTFIGLGNGTFGKEPTYSTYVGSPVLYICLEHLNKDNQIDVISANTNSDSIGVFFGHGDGTLANITTYPTGIGSNPCWVMLTMITDWISYPLTQALAL